MIGLRGTGEGWLSKIPVDPDAPQAKRWLREELAKAPYQAAEPTWFDRLSKAFFDWLTALTAPAGDGVGSWLPLIITVVAAAVLVAAFLVFGLPRLNRKSQRSTELFGKDDQRSAADIRRSAAATAAGGEWNHACQELFRAMARGLVERTVLSVAPGTTAQGFAALAGNAFPGERSRLTRAAEVFDEVRYLGAAGTRSDYLELQALDSELQNATPIARSRPAAQVPS